MSILKTIVSAISGNGTDEPDILRWEIRVQPTGRQGWYSIDTLQEEYPEIGKDGPYSAMTKSRTGPLDREQFRTTLENGHWPNGWFHCVGIDANERIQTTEWKLYHPVPAGAFRLDQEGDPRG